MTSFLLFEKGKWAYSVDFEVSQDSEYLSVPQTIWEYFGGRETAFRRQYTMAELCVLDETEYEARVSNETAEWLAFYELMSEHKHEWRIPSRVEIKARVAAPETSEKKCNVVPTQLPSINYEKAHGIYREPQMTILKI